MAANNLVVSYVTFLMIYSRHHFLQNTLKFCIKYVNTLGFIYLNGRVSCIRQPVLSKP